MYKRCYLYQNGMSVSQLINFISNYHNYEVFTNNCTGIIISIDTNNKMIYLEEYDYIIYTFNEYVSGYLSEEELYNSLNNSMIYYNIKVRDLITILEPYKDYGIEIFGNKEIVLYLDDKTVNIDSIGLCCCDCFINEMQNSYIDFIKVN